MAPDRRGRLRLVRFGRVALGAFLAVSVVLALGTAWRDPALYPAPPGAERWVTVVDHGWHTGIVLDPTDLRAAAVIIGRDDPAAAHVIRSLAALAPAAGYLEVGWGDAAVYRSTRRIEDLSAGLALAALLWPTPSALHVVALNGPAAWSFPRSARQDLPLTDAGFAALATRLAETVAPGADGQPVALGLGLYGDSRFYAARPSYSALRTCNHWVAALLRAAGVPASWSFSAFSGGLMLELAIRA